KDVSRNDLSEDYFLFSLRPVTLLAFATETDGNQPGRIVPAPALALFPPPRAGVSRWALPPPREEPEDRSKRQETEAEERKSPACRLTLPPLTSEDKKKTGEKQQPGWERFPFAFMLTKNPPLPSETSSSQEKYRSFTQRKSALRKAELAKTSEEIKVTMARATNIRRWDAGSKFTVTPAAFMEEILAACLTLAKRHNLTKVKKNAIGLKQRSARLAETDCRLMEDIQRSDDSAAEQARLLLQRHEVFQHVRGRPGWGRGAFRSSMEGAVAGFLPVHRAQTFHQNQLDTARAEPREMEKTMSVASLHRPVERALLRLVWLGVAVPTSLGAELQQQLDEVTSKVRALQDELSVLRAYIDGGYLEAVQMGLLRRSLQNLKEQQQVLRPLLPHSVARRRKRAGEEGRQRLPCLTLLLFQCTASCRYPETDKTAGMGKATLERLEEAAQVEQEAQVQKVMEVRGVPVTSQQGGSAKGGEGAGEEARCYCKVLPEVSFVQVLKNLEEIGGLKRSVQTHQSARDPSFAGVLLRR
ncbi:LOW QUALITY PROTEIN: uncharacterized protein VSU04_011173, partial [Chlamydotis macqueenii]